MNQRIMRHLINAVLFTVIYYFIARDVQLDQAAMFGMIYFVVSLFIERLMSRSRERRMQGAQQQVGTPSVSIEALVTAIGEAENIEAVSFEESRIKITLNDVDRVDQEALKAVATNGAYLSGNQLQITVDEQADQVADEIRGMITNG